MQTSCGFVAMVSRQTRGHPLSDRTHRVQFTVSEEQYQIISKTAVELAVTPSVAARILMMSKINRILNDSHDSESQSKIMQFPSRADDRAEAETEERDG